MRGENGREHGFLSEAGRQLEARRIEGTLLCRLDLAEAYIASAGAPRLEVEIVFADLSAAGLAI